MVGPVKAKVHSIISSKSCPSVNGPVLPPKTMRDNIQSKSACPSHSNSRSYSLRSPFQAGTKSTSRRLPTMRDIVSSRMDVATIGRRSTIKRIRRRHFHVTPAAPSAEKIKQMRWVIMPRSTWKVRWDLWIGVVICYSVVMIPYRIGFAIELKEWEVVLNYVFDCSFGVDIVFNMFTGFYDDDVFVYELRKIRMRYLKTWFLCDALSTLPLDVFFQVVTASADKSLLSLKLLRTIRLFRLLKLMRLLRLKRAVDTIQMDALNAHVLQTFKSLLAIVFIIHLTSCAWFMFYTWDPTGTNWVTRIDANGVANPYLVSFYWAANTMMSVGYGDIYGVTDGERIFSIFVECLGSICVGLIIANIQMLTENYNPRGVKMKQKLQETKEFLLKRGIPRRLRHRVISQFEYHWSRRTVFDEDKLLQQFPKNLRYEILAASMESFVNKFPFFGMTSLEFFVFTIPRLRPIVVGIGQTLVEAESVWEEVYFIVNGSMEAMRGNIVASSLTGGDICGIEYLIGGRRRYTHTFRSTSKAEVYAIYSSDLMEAMEKCSIAETYLRDLAQIITERYADARRLGRKTFQKQEGVHTRIPDDLLQQFRQRTSLSIRNVHVGNFDEKRRDHLAVGDDLRLHWSVIRHYSRARIIWDTVMGIVVAWITASVPFRISFDITDTVFLKISDRFSDLLFCMDIIVNFFTTYLDETGAEVVDRHEIRRHYLKSAFIMDLVSTIPFDFVVETATASENFRSLKLIRTIKLVKLLRLVRIAKIFKMNSQWVSELDVSMDTIRLLKLLIPVMTIAHYVGCFWFYISADRDADDAWWGRVDFDDLNSATSRYIASVYWATTTMATVGFGDIYAVNGPEQLYSIIVMIGGTTLFAYVVGTVIEVVSNSKSLMNREHEMGQRVNAYLKERGVSRQFMFACQEHLRYVNAEKTLFNEQALFDALSHSLRSEVILYLNNGVMAQIRFFDKKPKWFMTLLLPRLVPQYFLPGDFLISEGNFVSGIFFIISGNVVARVLKKGDTSGLPSSQRGQNGVASNTMPTFNATSTREEEYPTIKVDDGTIAILYEGEFFGYKEILTQSAAQYNVFARRPTGTYVLPSEFLDEVATHYPDVLDEMRTLFLQSITKQQTILHHWHNNNVMGVSQEEQKGILRRVGSMSRMSKSRREESDSMHDPGSTFAPTPDQEAPRNQEKSPEPVPALKRITKIIADDEVHEMQWFTSARRPSGIVADTHLTLASPQAQTTQLGTFDHLHSVSSQIERLVAQTSVTSSVTDGYQVGNHGATSFNSARPAISSGQPWRSERRSSMAVAPRRTTDTRPPLKNRPSMPSEINELVGRLLAVEGYVSPREDNEGLS